MHCQRSFRNSRLYRVAAPHKAVPRLTASPKYHLIQFHDSSYCDLLGCTMTDPSDSGGTGSSSSNSSTSLVWDVPVFEFFKTYNHGIEPTTKLVGQIRSLAEYDSLVPAPEIRVEIERTPGVEEIRVVKDETGDYQATSNATVAKEITTILDKQTSDLFEFDVKAYPDDIPPGEEKKSDFHRYIIRYDQDAKRILPGIRRAGYVSTMEEYKAKEVGSSWIMEQEYFAGITDTSTGDVWWATDELRDEIWEKVKDMDFSCPLYSDEEGEGEGENKEVKGEEKDKKREA